VLQIGGMATLCILVFASALIYYAEKNNPDPIMSQSYCSIPAAMWLTLLNLSGNIQVCDYTLAGRLITSCLCLIAFAVFALPVGAIGSGFEKIISEMNPKVEEQAVEQSKGFKTLDAKKMALIWLRKRRVKSSASLNDYGTINENFDDELKSTSRYLPCVSSVTESQIFIYKRRVFDVNFKWFSKISIGATMIAAVLEIISTCAFTQIQPWSSVVSYSEFVIVMWFTIEYIYRFCANGLSYILSGLGALDLVATLPWYIAQGLVGQNLSVVASNYDGPLRALRLLRLLRLEAYTPR
jgi:hypothetical protein